MPRVQVVVPNYNYGRYLDVCVASALDQDDVDVVVHIIDDCSSDNSEDVGRRLAARDSRVTYLRHQHNRGHIATYNEGIAQAEGDYFVLLSADDLLTSGSLGRAVALMEHDRSVGLVYGAPITLYGTRSRAARLEDGGWTIWNGRDWTERICRTGLNFIVCPEAVTRMSVQKQLGGYNPKLPHSADMEMWLRAAAIGNVGHVDGADQAYYRVHDASMQRTVHAGYLFDLEGRRQAFVSAFAQETGRLANASGLLDVAMRSLARAALRHVARALDSGRGEDEPIDGYLSFAASTDGEVVFTREWQAISQRRAKARGPIGGALGHLREKTHALRDIFAWRKWHATGVY